MKKMLFGFALAAALVSISNATPVTDIVEFPTGYFVDDASNTYDWPFYRWNTDDWGWNHNAIVTNSFSSATLSISAFDVDADYLSYPEIDNIYVQDEGNWVLIGSLAGANDKYSYTTFALGSQFYNEIATGLQVRMDIDVSSDGWAVTLAKSVISLDDAVLPDPDPNPVPEPATISFLLLGLLGLVGARKLRKN